MSLDTRTRPKGVGAQPQGHETIVISQAASEGRGWVEVSIAELFAEYEAGSVDDARLDVLENVLAVDDLGQMRLTLSTAFATSGVDANETIRLKAESEDAKPLIAWFVDPDDAQSKVWLAAHKYLHLYAAQTFAPSDVTPAADTIRKIAAPSGYSAWVSGLGVTFSSTGTLPGGLAPATTYYITVTGSTFQVFTNVARTLLVNITDTGTGTHTATPVLSSMNNLHQHFSIEVTDSTGTQKQSRFSIPYDYDTSEVGFFSSNVSVNDGGKLRVLGSTGTVREIQYGGTASDNREPDGTNIRWSVRIDGTAEAGANVGSDFRITRFTDLGVAVDSPLFIKRSSGFVGIQTLAPLAALELGTSSSTTIQIRLNRNATSGTASIIYATNGSDKWLIGTRNDPSDDYHIRDTANGRTLLQFSQSGYVTLGRGYRATPQAAKTGTSYTVLVTDYFVQIDATAGAYTVTLPAATGTGQVYVIKKIDFSGNAVAVTRAGSDTIEGSTSVSLAAQWNSVTLIDRASGSWGKLAST